MARDTLVTDVMTTDVLTLHADTTVEEAVRSMSERGVSGAPVVDAEDRLIGLLDDSDLILSEARLHAPTTIELFGAYLTLPREAHRYEEQLRHALAATVGEAMEEQPRTVGPDATVEEVATIMVDRGVSRVPVVDEQRHVVGIVTRGDIVGSLYRRET
jgi:CBS domain-containing protein